MKHDFADGKYTVIENNGDLSALRYGEHWNRDLAGDHLIYSMLVEVDTLKAELTKLAKPDKTPSEIIDAATIAELTLKVGSLTQRLDMVNRDCRDRSNERAIIACNLGAYGLLLSPDGTVSKDPNYVK